MTVPEGWREVTLGEIVSPETRRGLPPADSMLPFIGMEHVASHSGLVRTAEVASRIKSASPLVDAGDVLYGRLRPYLNKVTLAPFDAYVSGEFIVFKGTTDVRSRFLRWLLASHEFTRFASGLNAGDRPRVKWAQIAGYRFRLPRVNEQERIVDVLEEHLSHLDAGDRMISSSRERASLLSAALAGSAVAEALRIGELSTVGAEAVSIAYGSSAKAHALPSGSDIPILRMGNIQGGRLDLTSLKFLPRSHPDAARLLLEPGDVLFNRTNSAELVGKAATFEATDPMTFASYLIRVRFGPRVLPGWATLVINSVFGRQYVRSVLSQQVGQANVNSTKLRGFPLPVPTRDLQERFVERYKRVMDELDRLTDTAKTTARRSASLRRALLTAAFSGQLTGRASDADRVEELAAQEQ